MKKILLLLLFSCNFLYSQLPNQNTYLLKNLDLYSSYSACWGYTAPNGREYAILGTQVGTSFIDITDSANIREVDSVKGLNSGWREMKTYSHYAYVVSEATNSGLQIIDLQYLPDSVRLVKTWSYPGYTKTHSISQSGHYLFLNGGNSASNGGVTVVDVSDPINPVKMGQWTTLYVHDSRILNDTIWASNIYTGQTSIINATNKDSLEFIRTWRSYPTSEVSTHNCAFTTDRNYLFTTNEISSPNGRLNIWNIQDLNNITFVGEWLPTGITTSIVHNVEVFGNYAIIAHYRAGIRIVDISNPVNPVEVAWYDTYPSSNSASYSGCWGVYMFPSGKIIGSDISSGLFVIKTSINIFPELELNNPINNSINNPLTINFKWEKLNTAIYNVLYVSTDSAFNNIIVNDTISIDTSKIVKGFQKETKYYWRVRAKDNSGVTHNSSVWNFKTIPPIKINLQILIEGMYLPIFNQMTRKDTVTIYLRDASFPFTLVDSAISVVDSITFTGLFTFNNAPSGNYYIVAKHFNSIETWSKAGGEQIILDGSIYYYDFTTSASQAYGNNQKLKGDKYCVYSGDVNQDGWIDISDFSRIDNDSYNFVSGRFIVTDLNGDTFVDQTDMTIADNNSLYIGVVRP